MPRYDVSWIPLEIAQDQPSDKQRRALLSQLQPPNFQDKQEYLDVPPESRPSGRADIPDNNEEAWDILIGEATKLIEEGKNLKNIADADLRNRALVEMGRKAIESGGFTHGIPLANLATKVEAFLSSDYFHYAKNSSILRWVVYLAKLGEIPENFNSTPKSILENGVYTRFSSKELNITILFADQSYRQPGFGQSARTNANQIPTLAFSVPFGIPTTDVTGIVCTAQQWPTVKESFIDMLDFYVPVYNYDTGAVFNQLPEPQKSTAASITELSPRVEVPQQTEGTFRKLLRQLFKL